MDIAIGAPAESGTYNQSGAVYLWLGPVSSDVDDSTGSADLRFASDSVLNDYEGLELSAGDVDVDGYLLGFGLGLELHN
jgi:hypothetical protein